MKINWLIEDMGDDNSLTCDSINLSEGQTSWVIEDLHPDNITNSENLCFREICFTIDQAVITESSDENISLVAGENVNSFTPVAIVNNMVYRYDANNLDHQFAFLGFSITSATTGNLITIKQKGIVSLPSGNLIQGIQYLAGNFGTLITQTTNELFRKVIGYAVDSNKLLIINDYTPLKIN